MDVQCIDAALGIEDNSLVIQPASYFYQPCAKGCYDNWCGFPSAAGNIEGTVPVIGAVVVSGKLDIGERVSVGRESGCGDPVII